MHAQKNTCGLKANAEDLPTFVGEGPFGGCTPDLIINPHCVISRMTWGMLIEPILAMLTAATGNRFSMEIFEDTPTPEKLSAMLRSVGLAPHGWHGMFDGKTGEVFPVQIFGGFMQIQFLRHMVKDKKQQRSYGPHSKLERQPLKGRANEGKKMMMMGMRILLTQDPRRWPCG